MPIEIGHPGRRSFALQSPVLPAAGFFGYGRAYAGLLDTRLFGALVTAATTLHATGPERGAFSRLAGAFILPPPPNPGLGVVLREFAPSWQRWQVPVVMAVIVRDAEDAAAVAVRLDHEESLSGIELSVPAGAGKEWLTAVLQAFGDHCDLPVVAKLPLAEARSLVAVAASAGAAALVLGAPYTGADPAGSRSGPVYGPATLAYTLQAVRSLAAAATVPVIAAGGIYSVADARACLEGGAVAVQLDGIILLDPLRAAAIARAFRSQHSG
ncbi:MAG: beta/alpha barrel domain-containing protein [Anaerolineae bacterium]